MLLGDNVSEIVTVVAANGVGQPVPSSTEFVGFCEDVASGYYGDSASLPEFEVALPSSLDGSVGYWSEGDGGWSTTLLCSPHDEIVYVFMLLSDDTDADTTQDLLNSIAVDVLSADEPFQTVPTVAAITGAIAGERPLASLPGPGDMPEGFQFLDKDYVIAE